MSVKVIDKGWKRIQKELQKTQGAHVKVGYPEEKSKIHSGEGQQIDMATLAAIHEYGTETIPPRPFLSMTFDENIEKVNQQIKKEQAEIYEGKNTTLKALQRIGNLYKGLIQATFVKGAFAALSPKTIEKKGSSKPLIDTGQLRQSVDFEVVEGKK